MKMQFLLLGLKFARVQVRDTLPMHDSTVKLKGCWLHACFSYVYTYTYVYVCPPFSSIFLTPFFPTNSLDGMLHRHPAPAPAAAYSYVEKSSRMSSLNFEVTCLLTYLLTLHTYVLTFMGRIGWDRERTYLRLTQDIGRHTWVNTIKLEG